MSIEMVSKSIKTKPCIISNCFCFYDIPGQETAAHSFTTVKTEKYVNKSRSFSDAVQM